MLLTCAHVHCMSSRDPHGSGALTCLPHAWLRHDIVAGLVMTTMLVPVGIGMIGRVTYPLGLSSIKTGTRSSAFLLESSRSRCRACRATAPRAVRGIFRSPLKYFVFRVALRLDLGEITQRRTRTLPPSGGLSLALVDGIQDVVAAASAAPRIRGDSHGSTRHQRIPAAVSMDLSRHGNADRTVDICDLPPLPRPPAGRQRRCVRALRLLGIADRERAVT